MVKESANILNILCAQGIERGEGGEWVKGRKDRKKGKKKKDLGVGAGGEQTRQRWCEKGSDDVSP